MSKGWNDAVAEQLNAAKRLKELESKVATLEGKVRKLEKAKAPKPESKTSFRRRILEALGA